MTSVLNISEDLLYPSSDGNPMADSTEQYRWIVILKENLEFLLRHMADVFIAADLLWYPVKVKVGEASAPSQAPDVMVVFGRPKGSRRSYKQWQEGNIGPQVVFEILSWSNKTPKGIAAMEQKFQFYERHGVEEYYIYDPEEFTLEGWQRQGDRFTPIPQMSDWVSPRLGIRFDWQAGREWVLYYPDGQPFSNFVEQKEQAEQAQQQIEQERLRAEQVIREAVPRMLGLGLSVEQIAIALGLPIATVQAIVDSSS